MENIYALSAANASDDARAEFLAKTYAHLAGAIFAFVGLEAVLVNSSIGLTLAHNMLQAWMVVLGLFMLTSFIADRWASSGKSTPVQYAGLALYVVAQAIIFLPLMAYASYARPDAIAPAAVLTLIVFGGLTAHVFITKANYSWLSGGIALIGLAALGLIVCAFLFGYTLGLWFSAAMVIYAGACVLYTTSQVMHNYPIGGHVGAALALFACIALMFYYILQIFAFSND